MSHGATAELDVARSTGGDGAALRGALLLIAAYLAAPPGQALAEPDCRRIEVFSRDGCPHCAAAGRYLTSLAEAHPGLVIELRDIQAESGARERLAELARRHDTGGVAVPTFEICGELIVGFATPETTGRRIEALLGLGAAGPPPEDVLSLPVLGELDARALGLPLFTIAVGFADGMNPCALWVLLFLLSILANLHDRTRIAVIAGTFVLVSGVAYFLFMAAWLNVFLWIGVSRLVQVALGVLALGIGALNVKDFFAFGRGPSLSIPASARPGIYARVRGIVRAESLGAALAGALVLAVLVNFVELLCTAGLPALYTQILSRHEIGGAARYGYLALYNLAYVVDDAIIVAAAVLTLRHRKLQESEGRWLKLVSGLVILALGGVLLLRPQWLSGA